MTFIEYAGLMRKLKNAETMKEDDGRYTCLLRAGQYPRPLCLYNQSHGMLSASVRRKIDGTFYVSLIITSIDDSICSITGPIESIDKANKRLLRLLEYVEMWDGQVPTIEDFKYTAQQCHCYAETHI